MLRVYVCLGEELCEYFSVHLSVQGYGKRALKGLNTSESTITKMLLESEFHISLGLVGCDIL